MTDTKIFHHKNTKQKPKWQKFTIWVLETIAAVAFLAAGGSKLIGAEKMVTLFTEIGFGQWLRYLTGSLEIMGAFLIMLPRTSFWGAVLLACIMVGAILTHLFLIGGSIVPPVILLLITVTVSRLQLLNKSY